LAADVLLFAVVFGGVLQAFDVQFSCIDADPLPITWAPLMLVAPPLIKLVLPLVLPMKPDLVSLWYWRSL
jgi:hypothetical protein